MENWMEKRAEKRIESYKITVRGRIFRRETEKGAMNLADRLQKQRRHGMVEACLYDLDESGYCKFELIREF